MTDFIAPVIRGKQGIYWISAYYLVLALLGVADFFINPGLFSRMFGLCFIVVYAYIAIGLLHAEKSAWHLAAFFAFVGIVMNGVATACAPGKMASGDIGFFEAAACVALLVLAIFVFSYLRRASVKALYGVPATYRSEDDASESHDG